MGQGTLGTWVSILLLGAFGAGWLGVGRVPKANAPKQSASPAKAESAVRQPAPTTPNPVTSRRSAAPEQPQTPNATYTVGSGDTLFGISRRLGVDVAALRQVNRLQGDVLQPGQVLKVPVAPVSEHMVQSGDTAWGVADAYGITVRELAEANPDLQDFDLLAPGQLLRLPAGARYQGSVASTMPRPVPGASYIWPARGRVSSLFGPRVNPVDGVRRTHAGIDIAANHGDDVVAARSGTVVTAGVVPGYGNTVILEHTDGTRTLYAHNSRLLVRAGQSVERGGKIALVGATGRSTGPHLHFEVIAGGPVDPLPYLPPNRQSS